MKDVLVVCDLQETGAFHNSKRNNRVQLRLCIDEILMVCFLIGDSIVDSGHFFELNLAAAGTDVD